MKHTLALAGALMLVCLLGTARGQQPASYAYASFNTTFAKQLGYKQPGLGGGIGGSFNLTSHFTLKDNFEVVAERKTFEPSGKTVNNIASVRYYFDQAERASFFVDAGLQTAAHTNLPSVVRLNLGGGFHVLDRESMMPLFEVKAAYVKPLKDVHDVNAFKAGTAAYYNIPHSFLGAFISGELAYGRFHNVGELRTRSAFSSELRLGVFVNLSAISGY
jgi:hypothetical protein